MLKCRIVLISSSVFFIYIVSHILIFKAEQSGISYSTLSNALTKGIGGTSYDTVVKICDLLNLKQIYDTEGSLFNEQFHEIGTMLTALDEQGVHTVKTILTLEYNRCIDKQSEPAIKGFNGIAYCNKREVSVESIKEE